MITLDVADLVVIAGRILGIGSDAALSQIDIAAAQAALTEARLTGSVIVDQDTAAAAGDQAHARTASPSPVRLAR